ncbi:hypothetical protein B296_00037027 [Ensete ventricosum]|uniref:Uncharacterized protein n=1 Tax=Ensete ventricosum TaxID=4639 RepID=A0A426XCQ4_ENSVE|nr:hypothetical protein B296_00037027 [Ensete ventricosum]
MDGSPADLGGSAARIPGYRRFTPALGSSAARSTQILGYGQFNCPAWVGQSLLAAQKPRRRLYTYRSSVVYPPKFS